MELTNNQKLILESIATKLIPSLKEDTEICHVREMAFGHYSKETDEHFQIQVTVTRDESDFLDPFEVEEMTKL